MAWVPLHRSVLTHRKTMKMADILDIPEVYAVAHLVALWTWAMDNAPSGVIPASTSARMIARAAEWPGDAKSLVSALIESQYLMDHEEGYELANWMEYGGKLLVQQEKDAARKRAGRSTDTRQTSEERQDTSNGCPADVTRMSDVEKKREEEKRREEKRTTADAVVREQSTDPFMPQGTEHKPGKIDLQAILADRPHWGAWLEANRPAPKPGQTTEGFDRWKVCRWLNGEEEAPPVPPPPPAVKAPKIPEPFVGCLGDDISANTTWLYVSQSLSRLHQEGIWVKGESINNPEHCQMVIDMARRDFRFSDPRGKNLSPTHFTTGAPQ